MRDKEYKHSYEDVFCEVQADSHQFTLDLNTVNKRIRLSENNRVLCRESVCGRCYWEVEWSGDHVHISVSYKSISRKGSAHHQENRSDNDDDDDNIYRIGVFVDESAGTLSFYSVSDTMSLIHTVQTTFTQPLYPGFGVYKSAVKLCW
ncbi:Stonustoxin subunit alpha [Labeo rohita]|uniref:Stonustoxin subunit alpha n=1 Tax=Labeo rohita TaxID=84645 RepID=A0ABQ8MTS4_LABRO|nr:Stonustoxin subunit alpha [Labeo rohita]